ncbi:MAG: nuclear transport factor 2 family protein [Inquilinus limosus]|uniref:Nuclear transport factor 2 family protein n=1 Tax=Inquilinus limosus TaxID=171674 RepID=A0A952FGC1_9PROT|nr:nuclear transport factor 2 family protein [Inquilinus limosus]
MTADILWQDWARAEGQADIAALDRLLTPGFRGVGPVGFVLDKARWLQRFADGLVHESIELEEVETRAQDGTAVAIGVLAQSGRFRDHRTDGRFRVTLIARRLAEGWRLDGLHLSPIRQPG